MFGNDAAEGCMKVLVCNPLDALQTYKSQAHADMCTGL